MDITHVHKRLNIKLNECRFLWMLLEEMGGKVLAMVHTSIGAVRKRDMALAKNMCNKKEEKTKLAN